jgi:hypothetical protein
MPSCDGSMFEMIGILAVLALDVANGFFVAAEFSGVRSARRSSNDMTRSYSIRPARAPKAKPWRSAHPRCLLSSPYPAMPGPLPAMPRSYAPAAMK